MESTIRAMLRIGLMLYTVAVVLLMVPLTLDPTGDSKRALLHAAAALLGAVAFGGMLAGRLPVPRLARFRGPLLLLLAANVVAGLLSPYWINSLPAISRLVALVTLYIVAGSCMVSRSHVRMWMATACVAVALSSIYAIAQWFGMDPFPWDLADYTSEAYRELPGTFGNPNYAGHAIVLCIVFAGYLAFVPRYRWIVGAVVLYSGQMAFALQRGALLALAAAGGAVVLAVVLRRWTTRPIRTAATVMAVMGLCTVLAVGAGLALLSNDQGRTPFLDSSTILRYNAYAGAAEMIQDRPLRGFGPGNYVIENAPYWTDYEQRWFASTNLMNKHVHCDLLEIAVEGGLVAALAFLACIVFGVGGGLREATSEADDETDRRRFGLLAVAFFVAFVIDGLFGFDFYVPVSASFFFIFAGSLEGVWGTADDTPLPIRTTSRIALASMLVIAAVVGVFGAMIYAGHMALYKGRVALMGKDFAVAESHLKRAESLQPWNWLIPYHRGVAAQLEGDLSRAHSQFQDVLALNPNYVPAITYLARVELARAQEFARTSKTKALEAAAESDATAKRALALSPERSEDREIRARVAFLRAAASDDRESPGAWHESTAALDDAANYAPDADYRLWLMLGQSAAASGQLALADRAFGEAAARFPQIPQVYTSYESYANQHRRWTPMIAQFASLIASDGTQSPIARKLAGKHLVECLQKVFGYPEGALPVMERAVSTHPGDAALWESYFDAAEASQERGRVVSTVTQLLAEKKELPVGPRVMAMAWSEDRGALAGATKALNDAIEAKQTNGGRLAPEFEPLILRLDTAVRNAAPNVPGVAVAAMNMAALHNKLGQSQQAVAIMEETFPSMSLPERILAAPHYAEGLLGMGRSEQAIDITRELTSADPNRAELRLLLARVLAKTGRKTEADAEYHLLLAIPNLSPEMKSMLQSEQDALKQP